MRIGELAALAGVSTRTVRHYHHQGLLPEPRRLANGYRCYGLRDAVALARIRRLTELGLGLVEVRDVLADDAGRELHEVLTELDTDLARQEEAIRGRRARLAVLLLQAEQGTLSAEGPVSDELAAVFGEMARTAAALPGPEPAIASTEREVLALLETAAPPAARDRMLHLLASAAAEPGAMERIYTVYGQLDALVDAEPDDPRVEEAAHALAECLPGEIAEDVCRVGPGDVRRENPGDVRRGTSGADRMEAGTEGRKTFLSDLFAHFAPAQERALRRAIQLLTARGGMEGGDS
jgi:DNA-binding transcriptional MerR regulator